MKLTAILCFLFPYLSYSQESGALPIKDANKIIVKNGRPVRQNLFLLQSSLLNKGYTVIIDYKDFSVRTKDSLIENGTASYTLNGSVRGDSVLLTGTYQAKVITSIMGEEKTYSYDIAYSGFRGSLSRKIFAALEDIAREVKGDIFYIKEKKRKRGFIF